MAMTRKFLSKQIYLSGISTFVALFLLLSINFSATLVSRHRYVHQSTSDTGRKESSDVSTAVQSGQEEEWPEAAVANRTLGSGKIFVVNLPERTDRRDGQMLAASLSGLHLDFVPGVRTEDMSKKAFPLGAEAKNFPTKGLGSWRAHMNAISNVIDQELSSALILEDDVDWDYYIHDQMTTFTTGLNAILNTTVNADTNSPYGDTWDLLWLGHCGETLMRDKPIYRISEDKTMPGWDHISGLANHPPWEMFPEHTRFVHSTGDPTCSFGYAVSHRGAQKMMYHLEIAGLGAPFDVELRTFCKAAGVICASATLGYFGRHRAAGLEQADSDLEAYGGDGQVRTQAYTDLVKYSVRLNVERLLQGEAPVSQWSEPSTTS